MNSEDIDRLYELYRKYNMTENDWKEWDAFEVNEEHDDFDILYSEIIRLRSEIESVRKNCSQKECFIYVRIFKIESGDSNFVYINCRFSFSSIIG